MIPSKIIGIIHLTKTNNNLKILEYFTLPVLFLSPNNGFCNSEKKTTKRAIKPKSFSCF